MVAKVNYGSNMKHDIQKNEKISYSKIPGKDKVLESDPSSANKKAQLNLEILHNDTRSLLELSRKERIIYNLKMKRKRLMGASSENHMMDKNGEKLSPRGVEMFDFSPTNCKHDRTFKQSKACSLLDSEKASAVLAETGDCIDAFHGEARDGEITYEEATYVKNDDQEIRIGISVVKSMGTTSSESEMPNAKKSVRFLGPDPVSERKFYKYDIISNTTSKEALVSPKLCIKPAHSILKKTKVIKNRSDVVTDGEKSSEKTCPKDHTFYSCMESSMSDITNWATFIQGRAACDALCLTSALEI